MATNGEKILKAIKESGVTQVVFTGHSLGGGVAQVAHLYALSNWKEAHPDVAFRTLTFSAPISSSLRTSSTSWRTQTRTNWPGLRRHCPTIHGE